MKTIVLAAAKGGVGKTSLTAALATIAAQDRPKPRVGLIDLDPQGSLTAWWNRRAEDGLQFCNLGDELISAVLPGLRIAGFDLLFVDCPPGLSPIQRQVIAVADLVLVPTQASALDLSAIASTVDMAERARVPNRVVLNRAIFRSRIAGEAVEVLRRDGNMLWPPVHQRVEIAAAMASGRIAAETQPAGAAAQELNAVWRAVSGILDGLPARAPIARPRIPVLAIPGRDRA